VEQRHRQIEIAEQRRTSGLFAPFASAVKPKQSGFNLAVYKMAEQDQ
jgi:hypothetical protein